MNNSISLQAKPILSLCMIVKNERENLPRCLDSAKPYVNEMIVVDTGSEDGTPEIATQYGAKVMYFQWCDDFAAARNYAISQASGDWILMLDADEELVVRADSILDQLVSPSEEIAYLLAYREVYDYLDKTPTYRVGLFRNSPELRYVSRIHEQLTYKNQYLVADILKSLTNIEIVHYGHSKEQVKQKTINRNLPILERMRQEETLNLRLLYCLAGMYAESQQVEKSQECYAEAFERLMPNLMTGIPPEAENFDLTLFYDLGMQAFEKNDYETAQIISQRTLEWCPNYPPFNYLAGVLLNALGFSLGAAEYFENCIQLGKRKNYYKWTPFDLIFITTHPAYNLGCIYMRLQRLQEALSAFELAVSFNASFTAARNKIEQIKQLLTNQT